MPGPTKPDVLFTLLYQWSVTDTADYLRLFSHVNDRPVLAEASVRNLYCSDAAKRIHEVSPDARIIILLRNPARRLWSHYAMMRCKYFLEPLGLADALAAEPGRTEEGWDFDWHYVAVSRYYHQVLRYFEYFGASRVRVYFLEHLVRDPEHVLRAILDFIGLPAATPPTLNFQEKQGVWYRSLLLAQCLNAAENPGSASKLLKRIGGGKLITAVNRLNTTQLPPTPTAARAAISGFAAKDKEHLEQLLGTTVPW